MLSAMHDIHAFYGLFYAFFPLLSSNIKIFKRKLDVFFNVQFIDKIEVLKYETKLIVAESASVFLLEVCLILCVLCVVAFLEIV